MTIIALVFVGVWVFTQGFRWLWDRIARWLIPDEEPIDEAILSEEELRDQGSCGSPCLTPSHTWNADGFLRR